MNEPKWGKEIIHGLFPQVDDISSYETDEESESPEEKLFTIEELTKAGHRLKMDKAPELDGIPNEVLKLVIV